jgi:Alw26I/Eco31I/Esp3I family type II restriction endonuclease
MELRFVYPSEILLKRLRKRGYLNDRFSVVEFETITDLMARLHNTYGDQLFDDLRALLVTSSSGVPDLLRDIGMCLDWINTEYVPREPKTLSPGAMANPPDRFDGFHSFNECCRGVADTGRHTSNLRTYTTDRRVFEYWVEGDWIAADRLYGELRKRAAGELCLNRYLGDEVEHSGPCHVDHIGPISLGFMHRPEFQFLCGSCNSAKNNRMLLSDVQYLINKEQEGEQVVSWYARRIWDKRKHDVIDRETSERLSKLMRDNRHTFMYVMQRVAEESHFTFLASLINLDVADYNIRFENLRVEGHRSKFDRMRTTRRSNRYAMEQKARHLRVALAALRDYIQKPSRNAYVICSSAIDEHIAKMLTILEESSIELRELDQKLKVITFDQVEDVPDESFRELIIQLPTQMLDHFLRAKQEFAIIMDLVGEELGLLWTDRRYVRDTTGSANDE